MADYRLVYFSENRIPAAGETFHSQILDILATSRRNNSSAGVTGALMFSSGCFGQVLEGPQSAVEATFERIQQDTRHGDVSVLEFNPILGRAFDQWAMAYVGERPESFHGWIGTDGFDGGKFTAEALFLKLRSMVASPISTAHN